MDFSKLDDLRPAILKDLRDQQEDRAIYSRLRDELAGKDPEIDELLREIDILQLEIIAELSRELLSGGFADLGRVAIRSREDGGRDG